jgi:hypothetical protein
MERSTRSRVEERGEREWSSRECMAAISASRSRTRSYSSRSRSRLTSPSSRRGCAGWRGTPPSRPASSSEPGPAAMGTGRSTRCGGELERVTGGRVEGGGGGRDREEGW